MAEGRATLEQLLPLMGSGGIEILDASALQELDTAAVAVLIACQREARTHGRNLRVIGVPPRLRQLAQLYGVEELLGLMLS